MKVTVYFGNVRVIVPCGNGDILVRELMDLAITRYKKATGKSQSSTVTIHNLKSSRDDGILYPDDRLDDVADDREQIIAVFDESGSPRVSHYPPSTSSVCTSASPDLFSVEVGSHYNPSDGELGDDAHNLGVTPLQVRRGSEPALNCLFPESSDPGKRWSTAVVIHSGQGNPNEADIHENGTDEPVSLQESVDMNGDTKISSLQFFRGSGRLSILGGNPETYRWVEAADRQLMKDFNENFALKATCNGNGENSDSSSLSEDREKTIILKNETGPLGIHVVPDYDEKGRDMGLVIQSIESGGRIDRDGCFQVGDRITDINGRSLQSVSFQTAQEIFKDALRASQIRLELVRGTSGSKTAAVPRKPPPPIYPKKRPEDEVASLVEGEERGGVSTKVATVTPTKKVPASATRRLATANTRRIGKMLTIELTKGPAGLGFSVTTRDNPAGGHSPIYIKNVLPKGAAIEDGRLLPGDRLLEVNGISMSGKGQADAVSILRNVPPGKTVTLIVSRQEVEEAENVEADVEPVAAVPAQGDEESGIFPWKHREILTFRIPLDISAQGADSPGLGVSVKGKSTSTPSGSVDLGIFIKGVIPHGAADKDGRLLTNDQLVNINGISLLGMSNSVAMETLRNAMNRSDGPIRNAIILTVARKISPPPDGQLNNNQTRLDHLPDSTDPTTGLKLLSEAAPDKNGESNGPILPGRNPVIERLTGQVSSDPYSYSKNDSRLISDLEGKRKSSYSVTLNSKQGETLIIEGEYDPTLKKVEDFHQKNVTSLAENPSVAPAGSQLSLDESNPGFARDGFGRQSMSEKRHAQLDARSTDTYQRSKKAREERHRQSFDPDSQTGESGPPEALGPSLGLRKSSSLESLQTMIQELNRDDEAAKRMAANGRGNRSRGCNESFRAAVDRSYDAPQATTMDTLDEESESGSSVGHLLTRSVDLSEHISPPCAPGGEPFRDDLLSLYCRNSKSNKKKGNSLLKGLGSVFKFGKNRKQSQDLKGREEDFNHEGDSFPPHPISSKEQDRLSDAGSREPCDIQRRQLPQVPRENVSTSSLEGLPNRQERMQSLREQHQRMHQKRQGLYPLEQREELYERELKEKEVGHYVMPCDFIHGRSHSLDIHKEPARHTQGPPLLVGDHNRYSHYMNYKEIQQHINQRIQHEHLHPAGHHKTADTDCEGGPQRQGGSEAGCNSLPRTVRTSEHAPDKTYFSHDHGNYGRMNVHPFYPNNKLYSHIVPGSKV